MIMSKTNLKEKFYLLLASVMIRTGVIGERN